VGKTPGFLAASLLSVNRLKVKTCRYHPGGSDPFSLKTQRIADFRSDKPEFCLKQNRNSMAANCFNMPSHQQFTDIADFTANRESCPIHQIGWHG
jgi:hypothetical protein